MGIWQQRPRDDHPTDSVVAYDIETIVDTEPADGSFPPIPQHKPVAAAFLRATRDKDRSHTFKLDILVCREGSEGEFYRKVDACLEPGVVGIGWNSRGFDNPVLRLQAMRHRIFDLEGLARQTQCGRYDTTHCDLADQFAGYGSSRTQSLAAICEVIEIPVKTSVHGSDVGALWRDGDVQAIKRYVAEDVIATWIVWLHWAAWKNADPAELALPLSDFATWLETTPGLEPYRAFADCAPARWAREHAPAIRAGKGLAAAERRLTRERDERAFSASG
ncbi:putative 3'-5' exonuclease PolB-like domain-containing protein [Sphingomonas antarctica]|uniref:hypothetical protein n=1 Tax=Sphingomonas antarctica TaxID=2040274 RepID=UPI0039E9B07E